MPRAIVIAAAILAGAILASTAWTQGTTNPINTAWVVATCGTAPTLNPATGWAYTAGSQAPLTMNVSGSLCVNQ